MIEPAETRQILAKSLQALLTKTTTPLSRRNNNIPL
jgi:acetyl-CoA carboxylase carboxyltransferase component